MVNEICTAIDNTTYVPALVTITDTGEVPATNSHLHLNGQMHAGGALQLLRKQGNHLRGQITLAQLRAFESFLLQSALSPTTYRNIKRNTDWQKIYNYANRPVTYVKKDGTTFVKNELTVPCRECGVLLHHKLVSVDHFNAKKGDPLDAIFKVFRAVGYTEQDPAGAKGKWVSGSFQASVGGQVGGNGTYALNPVGAIVFSLFRGSNYWTNLQNLSMHNFVNLRPVCSYCNPSLGKHF